MGQDLRNFKAGDWLDQAAIKIYTFEMKAVFSQKPDSPYDDVTGVRYNFPKQYLDRVKQTVSDYIVYYEEFPGVTGRYYTGVAKVTEIIPDKSTEGRHYAMLTNFLNFVTRVDYRKQGGYEKKLISSDGTVNFGTAMNAVRLISDSEFVSIIEAGFSAKDKWPDRFDAQYGQDETLGFGEESQAHYQTEQYERPIIEQLTRRKFRDAKFRQNIRSAYDRTCAFTGLRLINGKGRPEIEAAHIKPVEHGGDDSVHNGIALSGTVHWMFDRGLLSISDDYEIIVSRQLNEDVSHILNKNGKAKVPADMHLRPHPHYMDWHRSNVFKQ